MGITQWGRAHMSILGIAAAEAIYSLMVGKALLLKILTVSGLNWAPALEC